jgi:hypothetical protein
MLRGEKRPFRWYESAASSRPASDRYRSDDGFDNGASVHGAMPPASRKHRAPIACETPAPTAESSLDCPPQSTPRTAADAPVAQPQAVPPNVDCSARSDRRRPAIPTSPSVLRRPLECTQCTDEPFQKLMANPAMSGINAAMESFFFSRKTGRIAPKVYRARNQACADVFGYVERFYHPQRRYSTIGISAL